MKEEEKLQLEHAQTEFAALEHLKKLAKVKEILFVLKAKSSFLAQLYRTFKDKTDISDNMLEYLYKILSDLINDQTKQLMVPDEEKILKKLKADIQ